MNKSLKPSSLIAIAACALAFAHPASAQKKVDYASDFADLDANADGILTVDEYVESKVTRSIKRNSAKGLSQEEVQEKAETNRKWAPRTFARMDANSDGKVDLEEYRTFRTTSDK